MNRLEDMDAVLDAEYDDRDTIRVTLDQTTQNSVDVVMYDNDFYYYDSVARNPELFDQNGLVHTVTFHSGVRMEMESETEMERPYQ